MTKELEEAIECLDDKETLKYIDKIANSVNPSEALEEIKQIEFYVGTIIGLKFIKGNDVFSEAKKQDYEIFEKKSEKIKQYILKAQEQEKVLEILFKKQVDLGWLWYCIHECINSLNEYNKKMPIEKFKLTEEEFELLKRYFDENVK